MTAEVGVMNSGAVALAADSAVTIGTRGDKIYTSADKLFQLSECAPVGIMIYGNAGFCGVPWETIVKSCRRELGNGTFDSVQEYGDHFLKWLGDAKDIFPEDLQKREILSLLHGFFYSLRETRLRERLDREAESRDGLDENDLQEILADFVQHHLELIKSREVIAGLPKDFRKKIRRVLLEPIREILDDLFGDLPFRPLEKRKLVSISLELLSRKVFGPMLSGIVIAGFGDRQYMPSLVSYELQEMIMSIPRADKKHDVAISDKNGATVIPFAQRDMVDVFMEGIHGKLSSLIIESTADVFHGVVETIVKNISTADEDLGHRLAEGIEPEIEKMLEELFKKWQTGREEFWGPVIQAVSSLPKDELGAMAEALVNLTKFRRRVTTVPETVSGPIDVAVITKGDGFVWIRRKHYFDASLNPRFLAKYDWRQANGK